MKSARIQKNVRSARQGLVLFFSLLDVLIRFAILRLKNRKALSPGQRADWLQSACRTIAQRLSMKVTVSGSPPHSGLVVSNHLSYLDILFYASVMPCIFVSKSEVLSWPLIGMLARCGGTIFVERGRAHGVDESASEIADALTAGVPVVLFPEGTSTDGIMVMPFRTALLQPAIAARALILPAAISYCVYDGVEADLCYYGEITFLPHLFGALAHKGIEARIVFENEARVHPDRKTAAKAARQSVVSLREKTIAKPSQ